ncbi:hypothetical protein UFOVP1537_52 [uncultured Caudovirales phage]|uniref:Uncharacterized protein n=2 Tax=root TaxID=1 RepID=A0A6J5SE83_9CAUD|nr:hypothetical protein UFOVP825_17 [uncultured Caudovirales phage]CAB4171351.1 hypothetical protein UFOVP915_52 [uncultured Caudovirales phage]CAB4177199.1 hypothetical protein UFOVP1000_16 [uncultured Caudovirales phage]CAB4183232.1 hypothetical protein UFOVP1092_44 [uncultured Caudovirales phage]CAB4187702.1 hypothetical protein UFOVP1152_48 [uncultured Caudovirales phage]
MAYRRVALIGCVTSHQTPRMRVMQDFADIVVDSLGEGDTAHLHLDDSIIELTVGRTPFPSTTSEHFSIRKAAGSNPRPTTVEITRHAAH